MSESSSRTPMGTNGEAPAAGARPAGLSAQLRVLAQYVRDLSFESPAAPDSLAAGQTAPQVEINVDVQSRRREDGLFESDLRISASATRGDATVFLAELVYGGLFEISSVPNEALEPILLIECPRLLFPFARRVLSDATADGGYPPLLLEPIDFVSLYRVQAARRQAAAAAGPGPAANG